MQTRSAVKLAVSTRSAAEKLAHVHEPPEHARATRSHGVLAPEVRGYHSIGDGSELAELQRVEPCCRFECMVFKPVVGVWK